jgi:hypothetical protein
MSVAGSAGLRRIKAIAIPDAADLVPSEFEELREASPRYRRVQAAHRRVGQAAEAEVSAMATRLRPLFLAL